ncbi:hypothetical protein HU200_028860 [Digitaria exilis]|uniref:Uncharacterized protein n=1 Tax=Digitaria exilis TaxID=1010633 RepID=A0A835BU51_9POAL|nr:hypothetical protein HU200_028860 [Digitaria exilis]
MESAHGQRRSVYPVGEVAVAALGLEVGNGPLIGLGIPDQDARSRVQWAFGPIVVEINLTHIYNNEEVLPGDGQAIAGAGDEEGLHDVPTTALLLFEQPLYSAAETIKAALSRALSHYYPIAGRIVAVAGGGGDDDVYIDCNGEGVAFVAASTSHALKEVIGFERSPCARKLLDELAVYYPDMTCVPGDPLLLMQVTEFSCGGFVLAVTSNHAVTDGVGMGQFLKAIGEFAGGMPWDGSLPSLPPSVLETQQHMLSLDPLDDLRCSTFEATLAILWKLDTETPVMLVFAADVRRHVGAMEGYYGNCNVELFAMARSGAVADGDVKDLIMAIKSAKDRVPGLLKEDEGEGMVGKLREVRSYDTLMVTSWRNLGFEQVDFGSGRPSRVTSSGKAMPPSPAALGFLNSGRDGVSHVRRSTPEPSSQN